MNTFLGLSVIEMGIVLTQIGLILLFVFLRAKPTQVRKAKEEEETSNAKTDETPFQSGLSTGASVAPETIAAIIAAIAAIWEGEGGFVVRKVRRVSNAPVWNRAGRDEQIYSRL